MAVKKVIQNFKVNPVVKKKYNDLCESEGTDASHDLRKFVHGRVRDSESKLM